jgi:hypothetical protein
MAIRFTIAILSSLAIIPATCSAAPIKKESPPSSERLRELQKERVETLKVQMQGLYERVKIGKDPMINLIEAVRELGEAELDLAQTRQQSLTAYERMVITLSEVEVEIGKLQAAGLQTKQGVAQIKAARLKAEIQLEKFKLSR